MRFISPPRLALRAFSMRAAIALPSLVRRSTVPSAVRFTLPVDFLVALGADFFAAALRAFARLAHISLYSLVRLSTFPLWVLWIAIRICFIGLVIKIIDIVQRRKAHLHSATESTMKASLYLNEEG